MTALDLPVTRLLTDFSVEMTGKDVDGFRHGQSHLPRGTRVHVTYLPNEDLTARVTAARAVHDSGLVAVPHLSARRLASRAELEELLGVLRETGTSEHVFVVAGDPKTPAGPFADALAVIGSGLLQDAGVRHVGITGYPQGHPQIDEPTLWRALRDKVAALADAGFDGSVVTQFGFDADAVLRWVEQARDHGVDLPVRVGVPGPTGVGRLLRYAARCGVGTSAGIARKYGFSLTNLMGSAGPDRFITSLAEQWEEPRHGLLRLHFYPFGGFEQTCTWIEEFRARG